jgi:hypothetical protein
MGAGDREQGDVPGPFYGFGDLPLVLGTVARYPAGDDLAPLADEIAKGAGVLLIYRYLLVRT